MTSSNEKLFKKCFTYMKGIDTLCNGSGGIIASIRIFYGNIGRIYQGEKEVGDFKNLKEAANILQKIYLNMVDNLKLI